MPGVLMTSKSYLAWLGVLPFDTGNILKFGGCAKNFLRLEP